MIVGSSAWGTSRNDVAFRDGPPRAVLDHFGITRLADLTGLDVIGLPVWAAFRPNSRFLSVSQGKGLDHQQARMSAFMEAVEGSVSERSKDLIAEVATIEELESQGWKVIPDGMMSRCQPSALHRQRNRAWVAGYDLNTKHTVFAPYELIGTDMRVETPWDHAAFRMCSAGLGAGFTLAHALEHALLEVIEHDAACLVGAFGLCRRTATPVACARGHHAGLDDVLDRLAAVGIAPTFYSLVGKVDVPVIAAYVPRPIQSPDGPGQRFCGGIAARLNPYDAALSALLEAVQSRLTLIAGSRDDMQARSYGTGVGALPESEGHDFQTLSMAYRGEEAHHSNAHSIGGEGSIGSIDRRLRMAGIDDVYIFELPTGFSEIKVCRVLAPGLAIATEELSYLSVSDLRGLALHGA